MDIKIINNELRDEAIRLGLCNEWQQLWSKDWDFTKLVERYKKGIDFCMENHYPSDNFVKNNFDRELLRKNFILVDDKYSFLNPKVCVVTGNSDSNIRFNAWSSGEVYISGSSNVTLTAKNYSFVMVHLYEESSISAIASDKARIVIIKHAKTTKIDKSIGDVRVKSEVGD